MIKETLSMKDAAYRFVSALGETAGLDKERDAAKIIISGRQSIFDVITFTHNVEKIEDYDFFPRENDDRCRLIAALKEDPAAAFDCRLLAYDGNGELFIFLLKPETARMIKEPPGSSRE